MSSFVVIPYMRVSNMNAQPLQFMIGFPAVTGFLGFAHNLALKLGAPQHNGVAIILHEFDMCGEYHRLKSGALRFFPYQMKAAGFIDMDDYPDSSSSLSSQPLARAKAIISLIVAIPDQAEFLENDVKKALRGGRLAGGSILSTGDVKIFPDLDQAMAYIPKNGFSVIERQDLMKVEDGDRDLIDTLLRVTKRVRNPPTENVLEEEEDEGEDDTPELESSELEPDNRSWIVPNCLGYAGISQRVERLGSRMGLPHIYAEPLVGLIQFRNVKVSGIHFWKYTNPEIDVFIATTT